MRRGVPPPLPRTRPNTHSLSPASPTHLAPLLTQAHGLHRGGAVGGGQPAARDERVPAAPGRRCRRGQRAPPARRAGPAQRPRGHPGPPRERCGRRAGRGGAVGARGRARVARAAGRGVLLLPLPPEAGQLRPIAAVSSPPPPPLPCSCPPLPACLQLGGFEGAKKGLAEGRFTPDQFMVLTRYAGACRA